MKCCDECPGWGVFETSSGSTELQRCDDCHTFANDLEAAAAALRGVATGEVQPPLAREVVVAVLGDLHMMLGARRVEIEEIQARVAPPAEALPRLDGRGRPA